MQDELESVGDAKENRSGGFQKDTLGRIVSIVVERLAMCST